MQERQQSVEVEENTIYVVRNGEMVELANGIRYGKVVIEFVDGVPKFCEVIERKKIV